MWVPGTHLACDGPGCAEVTPSWPGYTETESAARARGWRCYDGPSLAGSRLIVHLCPDCMKSPRPRVKPGVQLEGQVPAF